MSSQQSQESQNANDIAIVGMAAHLPGANSIAAYWDNLRSGKSSIRRLSDQDLLDAGEDPGLIRHKNYVPYAATLDGFEMFDGEFFGFSPKESAIMDPQHRQFLETAWEAFENAGHMPENLDGQVGVFAGCGMGSYFYFNVCSNPDLVENVGMFLLRHTGNDKDFMATRLSHFLDLHGPSINLQTACSTSLVAAHYACQSLLNGECDMALAGGVTIELPHARGYMFKENEILSPDGECHAFDHRAQGTVFGSGSGVVILRRLADAIADGDHIYSVIKGTAVNNDGAAKAGYLAPSVDGQADAIAEAQAMAGITADTVDYVECHGTGTYLGDPIEVAALTQAFRETTEEDGFCRIGSVKTNIGHLDTAAGVASLIKTSLALHNHEMPPSLGYERPNPSIDFENSPFRVNDRLTPWHPRNGPRRAGVNSLGVGGTNAHAVVQEAPERAASDASDWPFQILTLSGRGKTALDQNAQRLADHLTAHPEQPLADVALTLKQGRRAFEKRRVVVAETHAEAAQLLTDDNPRRVHTHTALDRPDVAFLFPGGGAQYAGMAQDLYETEPVFAEWIDRGLEILQPKLDYDIRALWLPDDAAKADADEKLKQPSVQLPLIMIVEYALAQLWMSWGITPAALAGHSMGENTAACVAGVMSFEDCIGLVHLRGTLFDTVPAGGMLSVALPADQLRAQMGDDLDLGAVNAPELSVASGPQVALDALEQKLKSQDIDCQRIPIDIAAHSRMLEPILADFRAYLQSIRLNPPQIPLTSNRTGEMMTPAQATDPDYWVEHLRGTVHFADCIGTLADDNRIFLEVGPGKALSALTRQHGSVSGNQVISSLRHPEDMIEDDKYFLETLGRLWALGADFDWSQIWGDARRNRVPLPTYAFQRAPYFIEPGTQSTSTVPQYLMRTDDVSDWGYTPAWRPRSAETQVDVIADLDQSQPQTWLMFMDDAGAMAPVADRLTSAGHTVVQIWPGDAFSRSDDTTYFVAPERGRESYDMLIQDLVARGLVPTRVAHAWLLTANTDHRPGSSFFHRIQEQGFYTLLFLTQAMVDENLPKPLHMTVLTNGAVRLRDEPLPFPEKSTLLGPLKVIPQEVPGVTCGTLDVTLPLPVKVPFWKRSAADAAFQSAQNRLTDTVLEELLADPANTVAASRGDRRYEQVMVHTALPETSVPALADGGTVLITGGFGGIGLTLARDLITRHKANIVLMSRSALPKRSDWATYLSRHAPQDSTARRIRAIQDLESLGGKVLVVQGDVCALGDMQDARAAAESEFGSVTAVIHAAGVIKDAPLLAKTPSSIEDVFTPKIHGTEVLDQTFADGELDWIALFASSSTVTAPAGQVDYVAANAYLNAYAQSRKGGKTNVVAINWGIWNEVGMAAEAVADRTGEHPTPPIEPCDQPMLDSASFDMSGNRVFTSKLGTDDWFIGEHRTRNGDALIPGTGYIELAAQALRGHAEEGVFELRDLMFLRPLTVPETTPRDMRVRLERSDQGYAFTVQSDCIVDGRAAWLTNAQATISLNARPWPAPLEIADIRTQCPRKVVSDGAKLTSPQEAHLQFGPRWKVLDSMAFGDGIGIADLSLPEAAQNDQGYVLHPALMDLATGWAMDLIKGYEPTHLWVPVSYGAICVYRALPAQIVSVVHSDPANTAGGETASFNVTLCAPDGTVCAEITNFAIRRMEGATGLAALPAPKAAEVEFDDHTTGAQPLSPAEERLQHNLSQGILPQEGADAFRRALALGRPQIVVSSMDLDALVTQTAASAAPAGGDAQKFERPELDGDFVAPENDIERTLQGFWEDLLGVSNVGVEDSFFDLGGHSLIAVRLFSMVKKAYRIEFPISVLFEAPTIRKCAALIAERVGVTDTDTASDSGPKPAERRFTHLVAMHDGEGGPRTPFFLVAGMFGNVLNLRHLAHLLGADRPFYGLQARGLYGDAEPHTNIAQAAADYIAEMRAVQPHGPYMIGGFSGGGITAYEIGQQLRAAGETVSLIVMLDTPLPTRRPLSRKDRMLIQLQEIRRKGALYPFQWALNRVRWEISKRRTSPVAHAPEHQFHNAAIEQAFLSAVAEYQVKPWDGRLVLFRPPQIGHWNVSQGRQVDSQRAYLIHDNDWSQHTPQIEVQEVPGDHDSMVLEPNVRVLAARMRGAIQDAENQTDSEIIPFPGKIEAAE